ncbi:MAG TPA: universal stress protein [Solirubrobacteraceae bacterium]|nr:universal stress protein [Solirubrobacteraceae bacterium]
MNGGEAIGETSRSRVLIAYDGSDGAEHALRVTAKLLPESEAIVLYVFSSMPASLTPLAGMGMPPELDIDTSELERRAAELARQGADLATRLGLLGQPTTFDAAGASGIWSAIIRIAGEQEAGLIVIGSRGRAGLRAALLGSVSNGVVHHADRPVLVVPHPDQCC